MRFARSLYHTQSFCNSWTVWRTGSSLILEPKLFINGEWKNVIRIGRRTGSSLILEPKWFANGVWNKVDVNRTGRRTGSSLILESRLFTKIILESRLFAKIILETRLFAWRLYVGQEPWKLQPGDWIPRMTNISSIVRNPPKWRSKQLCNQAGQSEDQGSIELVVWGTRVGLLH